MRWSALALEKLGWNCRGNWAHHREVSLFLCPAVCCEKSPPWQLLLSRRWCREGAAVGDAQGGWLSGCTIRPASGCTWAQLQTHSQQHIISTTACYHKPCSQGKDQGRGGVVSVCVSTSPLFLPLCFQGLCRLLAPAAHAEVNLLPKASQRKCCGSVCNLTLCRCVQAGFLYPNQLQITVHKP